MFSCCRKENKALRRALKEIGRLKKELQQPNYHCAICWVAPIEILFEDCNHAAVCEVCSKGLAVCPVCQETVETKKRIYLI